MSNSAESNQTSNVGCYMSDVVESIYQSLEKGNKIVMKEFIEKCNKWFTPELWENILENNDIDGEIFKKYLQLN